MIPYETDPSLHSSEPVPQVLDDGFSPRVSPAAGRADEGEPLETPAAPSTPLPEA